MRKLSYDGKGINDKSQEYSPRIATFQSQDAAQTYGELFASATEMLRVLRNIVKSAPLTGLPLGLEKDIQDAADVITRLRSIK